MKKIIIDLERIKLQQDCVDITNILKMIANSNVKEYMLVDDRKALMRILHKAETDIYNNYYSYR